jgi:hypothetical protein
MQTISIEDRLFKFKNRYVIYSIKKRPETKKLIFIFSGVDATPASCRMSYYGLRESLDATVVHIMDNFGAHGSYLLFVSGDSQIRNAVITLIREVQSELELTNQETFFIGSSKGATTAILYSLMIGGGQVIAGEPQINIGNFVYQRRWETFEQSRALAYAMLGRIDVEDRHILNKAFFDILERFGPRFKGKMLITYGNRTGYWNAHIKDFYDQAKLLGMEESVKIIEGDFAEHGDVVPHFLEQVNNMLGQATDLN